MIHYNHALLTVIDVETTGFDCAYHDVVQVACLPLDPITLDPHPDHRPFYQNIRPKYLARIEAEAMDVNGLDIDELNLCPSREEVAEALLNWYRSMNLPVGKRLIPLTHNSPFDIPYMQQWLGHDLFYEIFSRRGRDTMYLAGGIQDAYAYKGLELPFNELGLKDLCKQFGINIDDHHDALADCIATAQLYRELLRMEQP